MLVATASLAGRRWGHAISGWLVGFPFTSGPITLFLALDHGPTFAANAALGAMTGVLAGAAVALSYMAVARLGRGTTPSLAAGAVAFGIAGAVLRQIELAALPLAAVIVVVLPVAIRLAPDPGHITGLPLPWWDLPARMLVATGLVLAVTAAAVALGPRLSGLLATIPLYAMILAGFGHRLAGPAAAIGVWRGLLFGLFGFGGFYLALALALEPLGIVAAFALAIVTAVAIQSVTLAVLRPYRGSGSIPPPASR
ncbi:MAG TPA: hypothetical protein VHG53_04510 [Candidatus Limnocylindria bacterium]|nr:hypothetical protein [Candidatus Limnocylindria bacterium]